MLKRTALASSAVAILLFGACDSASGITGPAAGPEVRPNFALVNQTNEQDVPYAMEVANPCNGDLVTLVGRSHFVMHSSSDGSGGFHLNTHAVTEVQGVGLTLKEYSGRADDRYMNQVPEPTAVIQATQRMQIRGPTRADDFFVHLVYHLTVNNNLVPTAEFTKAETKCRG